MLPIILASGSQYRKELLERLQLPIKTLPPNIDESTVEGETALLAATRLAKAKCMAVARNAFSQIVIGSDQTAAIAQTPTKIIGKPLTKENAIQQLLAMQGQSIIFETAVCIAFQENLQEACVQTIVRMRPMTRAEIERYIQKEPALDAAGSAKIEGLGISLMESVQSTDPTALIGLPLITVARILRGFGLEIP